MKTYIRRKRKTQVLRNNDKIRSDREKKYTIKWWPEIQVPNVNSNQNDIYMHLNQYLYYIGDFPD